MKIILVLSVLSVIAKAAPTVSVVTSPFFAHATLVAPVSPFASPLIAEVEGEAPASIVHATHVKQVVVPQVVSYSAPSFVQSHRRSITSSLCCPRITSTDYFSLQLASFNC